MNPKFIKAFAAVVILGLGIAGGYGIAMHRMMSDPTSNIATPAVTPDKKPLYYYDPMYPQQKFDKPGKSMSLKGLSIRRCK